MCEMSNWKLAERERWQPVEPFLKKVGVGEGMIVAVVGADDGYFALSIARVLKGTGTVFVIDEDSERATSLREKLSRESLTGWVVPVASKDESFALPDASVDMIVMVDILHAAETPNTMLLEAVRVLRSQGRLVVIDWAQSPEKGRGSHLGPGDKDRLGAERVHELAAGAGFEHPEDLDLYELHYTISFRRPAIVGRKG
jgi:ubiquinone/menaquinone biosynthesis C-methylase UbiE